MVAVKRKPPTFGRGLNFLRNEASGARRANFLTILLYRLSVLKAALSSAGSGHPQLVMLAGEPGIGKTCTAREFTEYSVSQGAEVLWGRCYESIGMPPYWPWIQAIRSYVRDHDSELLQSQMGTGAADIAEIVPEVRAHFPDLEPSPGLDSPEQARVRLFDSITTFLESAPSSGRSS